MIETIIYTNGSSGYALYDKSAGFPVDYEAGIGAICDRIKSSARDESVSVRFSEYFDRYLLTVIFRGLTSTEESRTHHAAVNFLMETEDADKMLSAGFARVYTYIATLGAEILKTRNMSLLPDFSRVEYKPHLAVALPDLGSALYMGAVCEEGTNVYLSCNEPEKKLEWLIHKLPVPLRRTVSFYIGAHTAADSEDIGLTLCSEAALDNIIGSGFAGGKISEKLIYRESEPQLNRHTKTQYALLFESMPTDKRTLAATVLGNDENREKYNALLRAVSASEFNEVELYALVEGLGEEHFARQMLNMVFPKAWYKVIARELKGSKRYPLIATAYRQIRADLTKKKESKTVKSAVSKPKPQKKKSSKPPNSPVAAALITLAVIVIAGLIIFGFMRHVLTFDEGLFSVKADLGAIVYIGSTVITALAGFVCGVFSRKLFKTFRK